MKIELPSVDKIANLAEFENCIKAVVLKFAKEIIENERKKAISGLEYLNFDQIVSAVRENYENFKNLEHKSVINATGVVLHTNLGRSVISAEILNKSFEILNSYSNLEYDLNSGKRGFRYNFTSELLSTLFGCEDAIVVNNNAAAVFLVLNTFAKDRQCVVSRGELVEIGGSFRIPEVMAQSGAILKEIGTTNKTKISDYENAISENTALLMKVHRSNFEISGFFSEATIAEISNLAKKCEILSYYDLGSGYFGTLPYNLGKNEPSVENLLKSGVDLLSFSGDKIFGSVQSGVILGKKEFIAKLRSNQLFRMFRVDKVTISLLNESIKAYLNRDFKAITTTYLINKSLDELEKMAKFVAENLSIKTEIIRTKTFVGGGALALKSYPSVSLSFSGKAEILESKFRKNGIIGRIENDKFLLDFRSILDKDLENLIKKIGEIFE